MSNAIELRTPVFPVKLNLQNLYVDDANIILRLLFVNPSVFDLVNDV